jgi:DNA-directed RNA polymerase subunit M/transcription elongation factor TFIIS
VTINNVCSLFDQFEIVDVQAGLNREYYASSEIVYSDGEVESNINSEGYIHITYVHNATYIIFIDRDDNCFLCIYKYASETKYKEIIDNMNRLKKLSGKIDDKEAKIQEDIDNISKTITDDLIDINEFKCTECKSTDKMNFTRSTKESDVLMCKCNHCKTEYTFTPSKYYRLASKKIVYFKSNKSSRNISVSENTTSITDNNSNKSTQRRKQNESSNNTLRN